MIHLMPGTYSSQSGETYPVTLTGDVTVRSTEGRETVTILGVTGGLSLIVQNGARLEDVTTRGGYSGLRVRRDAGQPKAEIVGVHARNAHDCIQAFDGIARDCVFSDGWAPVVHVDGEFLMEDCVIRHGSQFGVNIPLHYSGNYGSLIMRRCEVVDCPGTGIQVTDGAFGAPCELLLEDCLVARNGYAGSFGWAGLTISGQHVLGQSYQIRVVGSTIVGNKGPGIENQGEADLTIDSSVIALNLSGDLAFGGMQITSSLIGDASELAGVGPGHSNGNWSGDPGFVDAAGHDYTLRFDSAAVDTGAHWGLDLRGVARVVDGNLDLVPTPDMGAFEHQTLVGPEAIDLNTPFQLAASGPAGGFATVVVSHAGFASFGATTQYGRMFLEPIGAYRMIPIQTTGGAPVPIDVAAFHDPALVGTSTAFQALTRSLAAPSGGAFSNPILVPVEN